MTTPLENPDGSFRQYVEKRLGGRFQGAKIKGYVGIILGLTADEAVEAWSICARMHLLDDPESPDDYLPIAAKDRQLPRYYTESAAQHRARLIDAWDIYKCGGAEQGQVDQYHAAGFTPDNDAELWGDPTVTWGASGYMWGNRSTSIDTMPFEPGPRGEPAPYPSQYRIVFAAGAIDVTPAIPWGVFNWGDPGGNGSGIWGPTGLTNELLVLLLTIQKKWHPSAWVFRGFRFLSGTTLWGDPTVTWGDSTLAWGGFFDLPIAV